MGLQNAIKQTFLETQIPSGEDRWLGLFIIAPEPDNTGTEYTGGGYVRVAHQNWSITIDGPRMYRVNTGAIEWPVAAADWVGLVAVGIFDAEVGGNLIWSQPLRNGDGVPLSFTVPAGDQIRFVDGELQWGIGKDG